MDKAQHFGPMFGERTRRHQMVIDATPRRETVVSVYEHSSPVRLAVELTSGLGNERADLTVVEARTLRDWLTEFIAAWEDQLDA